MDTRNKPSFPLVALFFKPILHIEPNMEMATHDNKNQWTFKTDYHFPSSVIYLYSEGVHLQNLIVMSVQN